jgi:molybdenum cofactor cytidylyltransferase
MTRTVAVVLAAGAGTRFVGSHKLLAPFRNRPVVSWAVEHAVAGGLDETWVVTGAVDLTGVLPPEARIVASPDWAEGQAASVQSALAVARAEALGAVVIGLGDQPLIPASAWSAVGASTAPIAVATYDGRRRNPVKLDASVWSLVPISGDEGARSVIRNRPDLVQEIPCEGDPADIDTREDLRTWS